jgi:hypothetical protein
MAEYFQDVPAGGSFGQFISLIAHDPHFIPRARQRGAGQAPAQDGAPGQ